MKRIAGRERVGIGIIEKDHAITQSRILPSREALAKVLGRWLHPNKNLIIACPFSLTLISLSQAVLKKIDSIDRKLDELTAFLGDVFLTSEEHALLSEVDEALKKKDFKEFVSIDGL